MSGYGREVASDTCNASRKPYRCKRGSHPHEAMGDRATRDDGASWSKRERENTDLLGVDVLLVEDDPLSREALETIFAHHGARVVSVGSAEEALASYEQSLPSVVVSDIGLPEEDGCALLRAIRIREFGRGRHTPAVAISAFPGRETSERAHGAGFDVFLPKPLEVPALLRMVHSLSVSAA